MTSTNSNAPGKTCLSRGFNHFFTFFGHTGFNLQYRCQVKQKWILSIVMHQKRHAYSGVLITISLFFWPYWLQFTVQMSGETEMNSINSNAPRKTCLSRGLNHLFTFFVWPYWLKFAIQMSGETEINSINSIIPRKTCLSRVFDHFFFHKQLRMVQ